MLPPESSLLVSDLRTLQTSINAAIEYYCSLQQLPGTDMNGLGRAHDLVFSSATKIVERTSHPVGAIFQLGFGPSLNAAVRTAIDLDIFNLVHAPTTITQLALDTGADQTLVLRILRVVAAFGFIDEVGERCYGPNRLSKAMTLPVYRDFIKQTFDTSLPIMQTMPNYLANIGYRNPDSHVPLTPAHYAFGCEFWEHLSKNPEKQADFDSSMKMSDMAPPAALPTYPFGAKAGTLHRDQVAIVDIGGGRGQFLERLRKESPDLPGRFVLQDLQQSIDLLRATRKDLCFEPMAHDMFTPQPIGGARWYHLRRVFHNWSDPDCHRVLSQTKAAFTPGFSTLLIQENVLPNQGCPKRGALGDIAMMQHTGMERNEDQWRQLLSLAGFEIVRIWRAELGTTAIIEAGLQAEDALCITNGSAAQAHGHMHRTEADLQVEDALCTTNGSAAQAHGHTHRTEVDLQAEDALCATNGSAAQAHGHAHRTEASAGLKNGSEAATDAFAATPNGAAITTDRPDEARFLPINVNGAAGVLVV